jgi:tRNA(Ile2) C34 agmatinyltransferase TiaS
MTCPYCNSTLEPTVIDSDQFCPACGRMYSDEEVCKVKTNCPEVPEA